MTRRRRREVKVFRKRIPKIFYCPKCGIQAVSVNFDKKNNQVVVSCGNCFIRSSFAISKPLAPVDAYNKFVDAIFEKTISE